MQIEKFYIFNIKLCLSLTMFVVFLNLLPAIIFSLFKTKCAARIAELEPALTLRPRLFVRSSISQTLFFSLSLPSVCFPVFYLSNFLAFISNSLLSWVSQETAPKRVFVNGFVIWTTGHTIYSNLISIKISISKN